MKLTLFGGPCHGLECDVRAGWDEVPPDGFVFHATASQPLSAPTFEPTPEKQIFAQHVYVVRNQNGFISARWPRSVVEWVEYPEMCYSIEPRRLMNIRSMMIYDETYL